MKDTHKNQDSDRNYSTLIINYAKFTPKSANACNFFHSDNMLIHSELDWNVGQAVILRQDMMRRFAVNCECQIRRRLFFLVSCYEVE